MDFKQVILSLNSPNNELRNNAEKLYMNALENDSNNFLNAHVELMSSPEEVTRKAVLVYLHTAFNKKIQPPFFNRIAPQSQSQLFLHLIALFKNEPSVSVIRSVSDVLTDICISLSASETYNFQSYFDTILAIIQSPIVNQRLLCQMCISSMLLIITDEQQLKFTPTLLNVLKLGMADTSIEVNLAALDSFISSISLYDKETMQKEQRTFIELMPSAIQVFGKILATNDSKLIAQAIVILDQFYVVPREITKNYIMMFVHGLITVANNTAFVTEIQISAINAILEIVGPFKLLFKRETAAMNSVLEKVFLWSNMLSNDVQSWNNLEDIEEPEEELAEGMLMKMGEMFGGEILYNFVMHHIGETWTSQYTTLNWFLLSLEDGRHFYKNNLDSLIALVQRLVTSQHPRVRYMALKLLDNINNKFVKRSQRYIEFSLNAANSALNDQFIPVIRCGCDIISTIIDNDMVPPKTFEPIASAMLQKMIEIMEKSQNYKLFISALTVMNFIIHYMKGYINSIVPVLYTFLKTKLVYTDQAYARSDEKDKLKLLKIKARLIEGMSLIVFASVQCVSADMVAEIFGIVFKVFSLPDTEKDELMPYAEKALTRLSPLMKDKMAPYLQTIVPCVVQKAMAKPRIQLNDETVDIGDDWASSSFLGTNVSLKTSDIDDKVDALSTLDLFVEELGELMVPYIEQMTPLVECMSFSMDSSVRMKAVTLTRTMFKKRMEVLRKTYNERAVAEMKSSEFYKKMFVKFVMCIKKEIEDTVVLHEVESFREIIEDLGVNGLTGEELKVLFEMFTFVFNDYKTSENYKNVASEGLQALTDEEMEMINHSVETESDSVMTCGRLFECIVMNNTQMYWEYYQTILNPLVIEFYTGSETFVSVALPYLGALATVGKREEMALQLTRDILNKIGTESGLDAQFNGMVVLVSILKTYSDEFVKNVLEAIVVKMNVMNQLRGGERNDLFEMATMVTGALLIFHQNLCKSVGIDVKNKVEEWFGTAINVHTVGEFAIDLSIEAVLAGVLIIDTENKLSMYVNYIGNTMEDETLDGAQFAKLRNVLAILKAKFSDEVFGKIWNTLSIDAKAQFTLVITGKTPLE
ncbi:importin beta-3, putative [Entamoeba invadens IP1]|uniref:Importin beta-3, putative n=1 Tax=Entamoeba invadens IP1 TaxID=370355 RepID=A0A0A1TV68_ENTIV|nr:importin beta-3, putative [Entamoeba invadens IP1]ELP84234.1 importin beta-3, putative [Entamoeba invadens IP1]|eukprot:XP_004183580.1 importin beta-3, putative [Entamoeba invadens IP1]